jgi:hypothetical protein
VNTGCLTAFSDASRVNQKFNSTVRNIPALLGAIQDRLHNIGVTLPEPSFNTASPK